MLPIKFAQIRTNFECHFLSYRIGPECRSTMKTASQIFQKHIQVNITRSQLGPTLYIVGLLITQTPSRRARLKAAHAHSWCREESQRVSPLERPTVRCREGRSLMLACDDFMLLVRSVVLDEFLHKGPSSLMMLPGVKAQELPETLNIGQEAKKRRSVQANGIKGRRVV